MITSREYFTNLTVAQLKSILADFNMIGISKCRKAELVNFVLVVMDGAHLDALNYAEAKMVETIEEILDEAYPPSMEEIDQEYRDRLKLRETVTTGKRKSYTERMLNRIHGYWHQNGVERLTPAQRRRADKKYNRQYGWI